MLNLLHGRNRGHATPHGLPPRSPTVSVLRAVLYWFVYYIASYPVRRLVMARAHLILHDRHFIDALVDPKRYRYGGSVWLLRFIWRIIPDLIILLDATPEVLQHRKQEVSLEETARQRSAYLSLVRRCDNGHVVNAGQALDAVAADVSAIILRHLAQREARRACSSWSKRSADEISAIELTPRRWADNSQPTQAQCLDRRGCTNSETHRSPFS
jgi:hypothetical protein